MATESIFHNIVIDDKQKAEAFITALEQSAETACNFPLRHVESEDVKGEDIKRLLGALVKDTAYKTDKYIGYDEDVWRGFMQSRPLYFYVSA